MGSLDDDPRVRRGQLPFGRLTENMRVPEHFWGDGMEERVLAWISEHYDPRVMPELVLTTPSHDPETTDLSLIGWRHEGTNWPPLLELILGKAHARRMLDLNDRDLAMQKLIKERGQGEYTEVTDRRETS